MMRAPVKLLEWRYAPGAILAVAVFIVLAGVGIILQNEWGFQERGGEQTQVQAEILAASLAAPLDFRDATAAQEAVDAFRATRQVRRIAVFGVNGRLVAGSDKDGRRLPGSERPEWPAGNGHTR